MIAERKRAATVIDPTGVEVGIPVDIDDDFDYCDLDRPGKVRDYYEQNGYVVVRGLIPPELCDQAHALFEEQVKPYNGFIYRQATANPERHVFTSHGFMLNSILNIQSLARHRFGAFRDAGLAILTHPNLQAAVKNLLGEPGKIVQTMYFEGNPKTWAHQDTYYLDAEQIGRMVGVWIAVEDIRPDAGRFYVYPKSHLVNMAKNGGAIDYAFHHDQYKELVKKIIRKNNLTCRAPALRKGDVLFWASKTIHGSLETTEPAHSRRSFTGHFIPQSSRFLQFQSRIKPLELETINGVSVHKPKDMARAKNRAILFVETRFPRAYQFVRKAAIKLVTG